jgi:hypothetical protein
VLFVVAVFEERVDVLDSDAIQRRGDQAKSILKESQRATTEDGGQNIISVPSIAAANS